MTVEDLLWGLVLAPFFLWGLIFFLRYEMQRMKKRR